MVHRLCRRTTKANLKNSLSSIMYSKTDIYTKSYHLNDAIADVFGSTANYPAEQIHKQWTKNESPWNKDGDWKTRYTRLYTSRRLSLPNKEDPNQRPDRISFLSDDSTPYTNLLVKMRDESSTRNQSSTAAAEGLPGVSRLSNNILSPKSDIFSSLRGSVSQTPNLSGNDIKLLKMVRERSLVHQAKAERNHPIELPKDETDEDDVSSEACMHGLNMRMTERSVSRSRVSRVSTRRDMDIPSILAYTTSAPPPPAHIGIPAFQNVSSVEQNDVPRWSIRRSVCPVCSQRWKDRSSINSVKNSGLKKNSSQDIPSVKASAKLRTSITIGYTPRPALAAVDEDAGMASGVFRSTSASWQLTRARRFRPPKLQAPPPEATAPPTAAAPLARKDLDIRVNRFLSDEQNSDLK